MDGIRDNYATVEFKLYDLATTRPVFTLQTRTEAWRLNSRGEEGGLISYHAPASLLKVAIKKSLDKLEKLCTCD